jgi:D-3-phosphoglycerate dehydrogenase
MLIEKGRAVKVLVTEELSTAGMELLRKHFDVDERLNLSADALREALRDANAIIVRSKTQLNAKALEGCTALKVIGRAGVGYDNIDLEAASRLGVLVMNVPDGSTISACEHTWALLLSMVRHVPDAVAGMRAGKWRRDLMGHELYGKTLGVIGLGKIGFEVAKRARGFGMQVIGYDPYLSRERADAMGFPVVTLDELITQADVLTLHVPLTDATRKMIGKEQFEKMRQSAYIVNCARGPLIDEEALLEALTNGRIAGAALDVYPVEPPDFTSPLHAAKLPNLITTPHLGASTSEAQEKVALLIAEQVTRALVDEDYLNSGDDGARTPLRPCGRSPRQLLGAVVARPARRCGAGHRRRRHQAGYGIHRSGSPTWVPVSRDGRAGHVRECAHPREGEGHPDHAGEAPRRYPLPQCTGDDGPR